MRTPASRRAHGGRSQLVVRAGHSVTGADGCVRLKQGIEFGWFTTELYTMCHDHCSHIAHAARGLQTQASTCRGHTVILPQASDHSHREVNYLEQFSLILSGPMAINRYAVIHTRDDQAAHNSQYHVRR